MSKDFALVVDNPEGDLDHAEEEVKIVAGILNVKSIIGSDATIQNVLDILEKAHQRSNRNKI